MSDRLFSGVQPTSKLHLGNYIGALKQWVHLQNEYHSIFCIVDLHAITVPQDPKALRENILDVAATYLAVGLDPALATLYVQSEVSEHAELGWIMGTLAHLGELERMTQFKDKSQKEGAARSSLGLFAYPVLMAADILLFDAAAVPVGEDQTQHVELTRLLARRFNERFPAKGGSASGGGDLFVVPQPLIQKVGARIMSLQDPAVKMSKSDPNQGSCIFLTDDADTIRKKIMRAVTDSGSEIVFDPEHKPAIANLLTIFHHMTGRHIHEIQEEFVGKGYGDFKAALAEAVIAHLSPITEKINSYRANPAELGRILDQGRDQAKKLASEKLKIVKERMGLGR